LLVSSGRREIQGFVVVQFPTIGGPEKQLMSICCFHA
jgi:hypothetical protein